MYNVLLRSFDGEVDSLDVTLVSGWLINLDHAFVSYNDDQKINEMSVDNTQSENQGKSLLYPKHP